MSKPTLGRGLGDLLGSNRATEDAPRDPAQPRAVDGGLRILIDGAQREPEPGPAVAPIPTTSTTQTRSGVVPNIQPDRHAFSRRLAAAALIGADVALLGWTAYHVITRQHALGFSEVAVCAVSALMAAVCGVVAARLLIGGE